MAKMIIYQGVPASGKTTAAREFIEENNNYVRVNRDDIRRMLGPYWMPIRENLVTDIEKAIVEECISSNWDVIIDDTNLNPRTIVGWENLASKYQCEIEFKRFYVSLEEALKRDKEREYPVGEDVIKFFYDHYENV